MSPWLKRMLTLLFIIQCLLSPMTFSEDGTNEVLQEEEDQILSALFSTQQAIETAEIHLQRTFERIDEVKRQLSSSQKRLDALDKQSKEKKQAVAALLRYYQRSGSTHLVQAFFSAESPKAFLEHLSLTTQLVANGRRALLDLEALTAEEAQEKDRLTTLSRDLQEETKEQERAIETLERRKEALESSLEALAEKRQIYEEKLNATTASWHRALEELERLKRELPQLANSLSIPETELSQRLTLSGLEVTITEKGFSHLFQGQDTLPALELGLEKDRFNLIFIEEDLTLSGALTAGEENQLVFTPDRVTFGTFPLEKERLDLLLTSGPLVFPLDTLIAPHSLKEVSLSEDSLHLLLRLKLF